MINARGETIAAKPAFRAAFKSRRCLIPADGFYEWRKLSPSKKQPQYITLKDERPFCFAGLWESWTDKESNEVVESCTIITTDANELLLPLHDRMPVILAPGDYQPWLDRDFKDADWLTAKLRSWPSDEMAYYPVATTVNNPRNEIADCIQRQTAAE
jgi:putative SOS response-associated peptidase YedK